MQKTESLHEVNPGHEFKLHKTDIEIRNLVELKEALEIMSDESFGHHVNQTNNDFSVWVREALGDENLANQLSGVSTRREARKLVEQRMKQISKPETQAKNRSDKFVIGFAVGMIIGVILAMVLIKMLELSLR